RIALTTMLRRIIVVIGKKKRKPGLLTTMSPGRRPSGNWLTQGQSRPTTRTRIPMTISARCINRSFISGSLEVILQDLRDTAGQPFTCFDVQEFVRSVRVRLRPEKARDQELRFGELLTQHAHERDAPA